MMQSDVYRFVRWSGVVVLVLGGAVADAQHRTDAMTALLPLPVELRADAAIMAHTATGALEVVRPGSAMRCGYARR